MKWRNWTILLTLIKIHIPIERQTSSMCPRCDILSGIQHHLCGVLVKNILLGSNHEETSDKCSTHKAGRGKLYPSKVSLSYRTKEGWGNVPD